MKFISYLHKDKCSIGVLISKKDKFIDIHDSSNGQLPNNMLSYLQDFDENNVLLNKILLKGNYNELDIKSVKLNAPLPNPNSFRDAYAFRQHVEAGRKNRGLDMIPEYDQFPVFYFSNHNSISGPGNVVVQEKHLNKLDFEFELGIIIGRKGKNIKAKDAHKYIAGLVILNDWSARAMQFEEMKLNLGPAKGKDFATSIGPYLVTLDELEKNLVELDSGFTYNLKMKGYLNNNLVTEDNMKNMTWSFSDILERISYGVTIHPGDLIGSGTCATGCLLENNVSLDNPRWLTENDVIVFVSTRETIELKSRTGIGLLVSDFNPWRNTNNL